jgi:hypothetical protein
MTDIRQGSLFADGPEVEGVMGAVRGTLGSRAQPSTKGGK